MAKTNTQTLTLTFNMETPTMSVEEAKACLLAELKKGEDDYANGRYMTIEESKARLGLV